MMELEDVIEQGTEILEDGANIIADGAEMVADGAEFVAENAEQIVNQIVEAAELTAEQAEFMGDLVKKIMEPVVDVLDPSKPGYDTELINTRDTTSDGMEPMVEYNLEEATKEWHEQQSPYSCAVCSQQFIINEFLDLDVTEAELEQIAFENGWYDPESGTSPQDCDNLLQHFGIDTQYNEQGTIMDIKATLEQGGRVIVAVDSSVLWTEGFGNYPLTGADHAIEVIGLDESDPDNVKVIINDSGIYDGCGKAVPLDEFVEAWSGSGFMMISALRGN